MVTTNKLNSCQQDPAWNSPSLNHATAFLQQVHHIGFSSFSNQNIFAAPRNSIFQGSPDLKAANRNGDNGLSSSAPAKKRHLYDCNCALPRLIGVKSTPTDASATAQKRFLIFDQSVNQTRFFFSQGLPKENEIMFSRKPLVASGLCNENVIAPVEQLSYLKPIYEDKLDGSYVNDRESDFHEDTEDIDALLCSDGTDEEYGDGVNCEDDDVTSTGHSPYSNQGTCNEQEKDYEELTEEVGGPGGSCKRQRLPDGGYMRSSLADTVSSTKLTRWDNDDGDDYVQSSSVKGSLPLSGKNKDSGLRTRENKLGIWETLRILESLISGINSKDPLFVIDEAIDYLKSLRLKCKALGVGFPQEYPTTPQFGSLG